MRITFITMALVVQHKVSGSQDSLALKVTHLVCLSVQTQPHYEETFTTGAGVVDGTPAAGDTTVNVSAGGGSVGDGGAKFNVGDIVHFQETDGSQYEITAIVDDALTIRQLDNPNGGGLKSALADGTDVRRRWKYYDQVDAMPDTSTWATGKNITNDEIHVVVYDETGDITGYDSDLQAVEQVQLSKVFAFVSQAEDAKTAQGGTNYYVNVINTHHNM